MGKRAHEHPAPVSRDPGDDDATENAHAVLHSDAGPQNDLINALDDYRAGFKDLHEAAKDAGIPDWDLLEAAQATPDPLVGGAKPALYELPTFVRHRNDQSPR